MNLFNPLQATFQSGQLSPSFLGRRDTPQYYTGARKIKNMVVTPSGAVTRRPPTKFLQYRSSGTNALFYLFPFQSGPDKSYLIEVNPGASSTTFYIWKRSSGTTSLVHNFTTGSEFTLSDSWQNCDFTQSRDVMYFTFTPATGSQKITKLTRISDTSWTLASFYLEDGPYDEINLDVAVKLVPDAKNATTISAQDDAGTPQPVYMFTSADEGRLIRIRHNVDPDGNVATWWGYAVIDNVTTGTDDGSGNYSSVDVTTLRKFGSTNQTKNWRLGVYSDAENPTKCHLHQNRLILGYLNRISGSQGNSFENFGPDNNVANLDYDSTYNKNETYFTQTPDSGIDLKLLDFRAESINWFSSDQVLHFGTNDGRYILTSSDGTLQPANLSVVKQSNVGTANIRPVVVDNTIYVRYDKEALLRTDFNFRRDRYEDKNLNIYSDTILRGKVSKLAFTSYPFNIVWVLLEDGKLASLTYDTEQEIIAWSYHEIKDCTITDIVSLKAEDEKEVLYLSVLNDNESAPKGRSIHELDLSSWEYLKTDTATTDPLLDGYMEFSSTASITGATHLKGSNIMAIQDGVNYPQTGTVSATGTFTLAESITGDFHIGLPVEIELQTFPIDVPTQNTTQIGKVKGIKDLQCQMLNTGALTAQLSTSAYPTQFKFRSPSDPVNAAPPLFTGQKEIGIDNVNNEDMSITFTQDYQAPCTILALSYEVNIER